MRHLRTDYDPIQDPRPGGVGEGEPVFLLRAKDVVAPAAVRAWAERAETLGADSALCDRVRAWATEMEHWQIEHGCKVPDVPDGALLPRTPEVESES